MDTFWIELTLVVVAILANGFFAGSEFALVSSRIGRLVQLRAERVSGAGTAIKLKESPETFLATIQIAITLVGALASAVGGAAAAEEVSPWLAGLPVPGAANVGRAGGAGPRHRRHHLLLPDPRRADPEGPGAAQPRAPGVLRGAAVIAAISRAASGPVAFLTLSTNAVLRLLGQGAATAVAVRLGGGREVPAPGRHG